MRQQGDFLQVLQERGYAMDTLFPSSNGINVSAHPELTTGTTVFAMKYADGVLVAGDRRATAGNVVMYDRTDKVLEIDRFSVMAIAECQLRHLKWREYLEHSFKYYRRSQLQDLSFEGKLRALINALEKQCTGGVGWDGDRRAGLCRVRPT